MVYSLCLIRQKVEAGPTGCTVLGRNGEKYIIVPTTAFEECSRDRKGIG